MTVTRQVRTSRWGAPVVTAVSSTTRRWHRTHRTHHTRRTHPSRRYRRQRINPSNLARPLPPSDRWVFPISLSLSLSPSLPPEEDTPTKPREPLESGFHSLLLFLSSPHPSLHPLSGVLTRPSLPKFDTPFESRISLFPFLFRTRFGFFVESRKWEPRGQSKCRIVPPPPLPSSVWRLREILVCSKRTKQLDFSFLNSFWVFVGQLCGQSVESFLSLSLFLSFLSGILMKFLLSKFGMFETTKYVEFFLISFFFSFF